MMPIDCDAFYAAAYAQYQANRNEDAAEIFSVLCARQPLEARYWFGLGASLQASSKHEKALHAWAMAALIRFDDPYPHFHAAECSYSLGKMQDALLALQEAKRRIHDPSHELNGPIAVLEEQWRSP